MGMQTQALIVLVLCGIILMVIAIFSWYRRKSIAKKDSSNSISRIQETVVNGQRTFRIATVSQHSGHLSLDIYEIRLPRPTDPNGVASIRLLPSANSTTTRGHNNNHTQIQHQPPPPPFSTAINMPSPARATQEEEESSVIPPPPTYEEIIPTNPTDSLQEVTVTKLATEENNESASRNITTLAVS